MNTTVANVVTFVASLAAGCGAAVAIASSAAVTQVAPSLRGVPQSVPLEVIRLEPVVVTLSKATYDAIRAEQTEVARAASASRVTRG